MHYYKILQNIYSITVLLHNVMFYNDNTSQYYNSMDSAHSCIITQSHCNSILWNLTFTTSNLSLCQPGVTILHANV